MTIEKRSDQCQNCIHATHPIVIILSLHKPLSSSAPLYTADTHSYLICVLDTMTRNRMRSHKFLLIAKSLLASFDYICFPPLLHLPTRGSLLLSLSPLLKNQVSNCSDFFFILSFLPLALSFPLFLFLDDLDDSPLRESNHHESQTQLISPYDATIPSSPPLSFSLKSSSLITLAFFSPSILPLGP